MKKNSTVPICSPEEAQVVARVLVRALANAGLEDVLTQVSRKLEALRTEREEKKRRPRRPRVQSESMYHPVDLSRVSLNTTLDPRDPREILDELAESTSRE